jgi:hypothetical protein
MSLRMDIHLAFDEIAPSTLGLAERVVETTLAEAPDRRKKERWVYRVRAPIALVAAFLLIALAAGALIGGPLWRDWRNWSTAHPPQINQAQLNVLESRPLNLPVLQPGAACPVSPLTDASAHGPEAFLFGTGPVYATTPGNDTVITNWGTWTAWPFQVDTKKVSGLVLIRGTDLQTNQTVVFAAYPLHASGQAGDGIPTGKVIRTEVINGETEQVFPEVVLDTSRPYELTKKGDWPIFKAFTGYPKSAGGCIAFQVDGSDFTEVIVIAV